MQLTALIGKKSYQKQGFLEDGRRIPLTGILVSGNFVTQIKTADKDGYQALQIGIDNKKKPTKAMLGISKKAGLEKSPRFFREVRADGLEETTLGSELSFSEVFHPGDIVDVTGTSKGKGFAGGVKRHNFKGGSRTHGQSDRERAPGSIGQTTTPGRVYKGKRMAGRMGNDTVTVKNLEIIEVMEDGMLLVKGLVPGSLNSVVTIKKVGENKKFVPLYQQKNNEESSRLSASEDEKQVSEESKNNETASLSESQPPTSNENQEVETGAALDSPESVQAPASTEPSNSSENVQASSVPQEDPENKKEEVKENAS